MKLVAACSVTALTAGLLVASGSVASADSAQPLGLSSYRDIVVDQAHGRVYVSGGSVVTANLAGTITGSVPGVTSARQMALTADGSQLVVANGDGLTVIDAVTATVVRTIATGANSCPDAVAPAAGLMFFTYGGCAGGTPGLGAVNLTNDGLTTGLTTGGGSLSDAKLVSVAAAPGMLAAKFGDTLTILDATGGVTPATSVRATSQAANSNFEDLALTPNGAQVITASGGTYHHQVFSTTNLAHVGDYPTAAYPNGVAVRADGLVAAGINGVYNEDVWFFPSGASTTIRKVGFGDAGGAGVSSWLEPQGLAFGAKLAYAVTSDVYGDYLTLRTVTAGPPASVSITTDLSRYRYGGTATVTARLLSPTTVRTVSVYATGVGTARRLIRTGTVDSGGRLVVKVSGLTRNTTFQVVFGGDGDFAPGTASRAVAVSAKLTMSSASRRKSGIYHLFRPGTRPLVNGLVSAPNPGRCVRAVGQRFNGRRWVTFDSISCLRLTPGSRFGVQLRGRYTRGMKVRVSATFTGGSVNAASPKVWYYVAFR